MAAGLAAGFALAAAPQPARAQGLFESIFGGLSRAFAPPSAPTAIHAYSAPNLLPPPNRPPDRVIEHSLGPPTVYCVRRCDGHYFPVQAHAGLSVAQACRAFCPASRTRIYRGSTIATAVASDGRRYVDLPHAFLYRKHLVAGCTCNGRDAFGLAHLDPLHDPTLRPGDVIATRQGFYAFAGGRKAGANFTPVQDYAYFSKRYRAQLQALRIAPSTPGAPGEFSPATSAASDNRTAQLER